MSVHVFKEMLGVVMDSVTGDVGDEQMVFTVGERTFTFWYEHDCCANCSIEDICGDLSDLVGSPILEAEEVDNDHPAPDNADSYTWTFYRFATAKGAVTVRWLGESNGYYSESVSFADSHPDTCSAHDECRVSLEMGRACKSSVVPS